MKNLNHPYQVQTVIDENANSPLACTTDHTNTATTQCFGITLTSNTFNNFNFEKKKEGDYQLVNTNFGMQYYGLILSLESFLGPI